MKHIYKEMKHLSILFILITQLFTFTSCVEEEEYANTPTGNFEALWRIMDEHYCFFDLKQKELGVDWNNVHARYSSQVSDAMNNEQLFEFLSNMIGELKDGKTFVVDDLQEWLFGVPGARGNLHMMGTIAVTFPPQTPKFAIELVEKTFKEREDPNRGGRE